MRIICKNLAVFYVLSVRNYAINFGQKGIFIDFMGVKFGIFLVNL